MTLTKVEQSQLQRKLRGASWAAEGDNVFTTDSGKAYKVRSYNNPAIFHYVTLSPRPSCNCWDFKKHEKHGVECRHIHAARVYERALDAIAKNGWDEMEFRYRLEESARKTRFHADCWKVLASLISDYRAYQAQQSQKGASFAPSSLSHIPAHAA